jgi:hypothetical protein
VVAGFGGVAVDVDSVDVGAAVDHLPLSVVLAQLV